MQTRILDPLNIKSLETTLKVKFTEEQLESLLLDGGVFIHGVGFIQAETLLFPHDLKPQYVDEEDVPPGSSESSNQ